MNKIILPLILAVTLGGLTAASAENGQKTTLTVRADGTCEIKMDSTQSRATVEREVKMWIRFQNSGDNDNGDDEPKPDAPKKEAADKPLTDAELIAKLRNSIESRYEQMEEDPAPKIDLIEITNDTAHVVQTRSFASIEDYLAAGRSGADENSMWSGTSRFEKDANGRLMVTMTPDPQAKRYEKYVRRQAKLTGTTTEVRTVLPGKIISSSYTNVQDNATWYTIDPKDDATITAAMAYYEKPAVVISELGGLKLDQPLDSKELAQSGRRRVAKNKSNELPVTDAGPGFVAEAASVTTTTAHLFPDAQKYYANQGSDRTGTVVRAKLFAPKGRFMRSVSEVKVTKAVDDKGRNVAPADAEGTMSTYESGFSFNSNGEVSEGPTQMQIDLRLALPERDAQAIQEISAEAVAVTYARWKEMTVTNLQGEIDLSAVLPGAKMTVKNVKVRKQQTSMQLDIKGPPSIRELDVKNKREGNNEENMSSANIMERGFRTVDGQSTRKATLQIYSFGADLGQAAPASTNAPSLVVRFPDEERRERVKFKLSALDLF